MRKKITTEKITYSDIEMVKFGKGKFSAVIYPVPVKDRLKLYINSEVSEQASSIFMMRVGKVNRTQTVSLSMGANKKRYQCGRFTAGSICIKNFR